MSTKLEAKILATDKLETIKGECCFCHKETDAWCYCFGCKKFVCGQCETDEPPIGRHSVVEHKEK